MDFGWPSCDCISLSVQSDVQRLSYLFHHDGHYRTAEEGYLFLTKPVIEMYEKVHILPYFDATELPVMEMQYGDDGMLYFLQYLKTGNKLIARCPWRQPVHPVSLHESWCYDHAWLPNI